VSENDSRRRTRVLLVGVGGQGVITAAAVLGLAVRDAGLGVNVGQLHGMAQRGGSVEATVVIGAGSTAFIGAGEADIVVGFEPLETLRAAPRMRPGAVVLMNTGHIPPFALAQARQPYPDMDDLVATLGRSSERLVLVDGPEVAVEAGDVRVLNSVMLGALVGLGVLPIDAVALERAVVAKYPSRYQQMNLRAIELGLAATASRGVPG